MPTGAPGDKLLIIDGNGFRLIGFVLSYPVADVREQDNAEKRKQRKPGDAGLALGQHESRKERAERGACVAAELEERLGRAVLAPRGQASDARGLRMEHGRANADERGGSENRSVTRSYRNSQETNESDAHPDGQRVGLRAAVGIETDERR